jgi:hypothetical protein
MDISPHPIQPCKFIRGGHNSPPLKGVEMAKNKEEVKEVEEVPAKVEEVKKEVKAPKLLEFTAVDPFIDGDLAEAFKELGYAIQWNGGETRHIPKWLAKRVLSSGGKLLTKGGEELSLE